MRRVVVTGLGLLTPLGCGVEIVWHRLLRGDSSATKITKFDPSDYSTSYACEIPFGDDSEEKFNPDKWMNLKDRRKVDDFILYGICAADQAVKDAGWIPDREEDLLRTGVMIGSGIGGLQSIGDTANLIRDKGPRRVSPFFIPGALINLISGQVSIRYGFKGPNHSVVTACSTGAHAIGDAARFIKSGEAEVMIAGGAESPITELGIAGFNACKALSTKFTENPSIASRPYDVDRDGFVMGEGAVDVIHRKELQDSDNREELKQKFVDEYNDKFSNPDIAAKLGLVDKIIKPSETRKIIIEAFKELINKTNVGDKHGNIPL